MVNPLLRCIVPHPAIRPLRLLASAVPRRWRAGPCYWRWRRFLSAAQGWSPEVIEAWQLQRLQKIVRHAYLHTNGYRELYRQAGVRPEDIRTLSDIRHLPFTTKRMFQDDLEAFSVRCAGGRYVTTGGSTGIPMGLYETAENVAIERASIHSAWATVGWRFGDLNAVLRGGFVGSDRQPYRYDPYHHVLELSSYHLTAHTLPLYVDALRRYRAPVLQAYPSALNHLCRLFVAAPLSEPLPVNLILLGSENVYDWQVQLAREVFPAATVFAWYGHSEKAIFAPWCPQRQTYHVQPFYGLPELLGDDGRETQEGEEGELVGTSFHAFATPFIRYRTTDRAVRGPSPCRACGHTGMILERVVGRSHELILTGSGRLISMTAINMHDDVFDDLRQFQFFQEQQGKVVFRYVPKRQLSSQVQRRIRERLMAKLGGDVELSLAEVPEIPRTSRGKLSFLDQRLEIPQAARGFRPVAA